MSCQARTASARNDLGLPSSYRTLGCSARPHGKVPPSMVILVITAFGRSSPHAAGACSSGRGRIEAPSRRQGPFENGGPCGCQARRNSAAGSEGLPSPPGTPAQPAAGRTLLREVALVVTKLRRLEPATTEVRLRGQQQELVVLLRGHRLCPAGSAFRHGWASCPGTSDGPRAQGRASLLLRRRA